MASQYFQMRPEAYRVDADVLAYIFLTGGLFFAFQAVPVAR
jgi:hypothetical protein